MQNLLDYILLLFESTQVAFMVYFMFLLYRENLKKYAYSFFVILVLFVSLKFRLIPYELGGYFDRFLWGSYDILFILFYIYLLTHNQRKPWKQFS